MASLTEVVDDYLKRLKQCERNGVWMQMKMKGGEEAEENRFPMEK